MKKLTKSLFLEYLIPNISKFFLFSQASAGKYQIQTDKAQSQLDKTQSEFDRMQEKFERSQNEIRKVSSFKIIISNPHKLYWHYRLIIFRKFLFLTLLSKSLNEKSTWQNCYAEKSVKFFYKSVNKRDILKIVNLYPQKMQSVPLHLLILYIPLYHFISCIK